MPQKTPLYDHHVALKANIVDFSGWLMPIHYGSQIAEHNAVRNNVGLFDVSHMGVVELQGAQCTPFLRYLLANDVAKLKNGDALYSCLLNDDGGVIDDLIVYRVTENNFRMVINAGCREKDMHWILQHAKKFDVELFLHDDLCMLALQGKNYLGVLENIFSKEMIEKIANLKSFQFCTDHRPPTTDHSHTPLLRAGFCELVPPTTDNRPLHTDHRPPTIDHCFIAKTGYTGEPGVEMILLTQDAIQLWEKLIKHGAQPCGLGARDTLRLEAGYNLFGAEMNENTSPLVSNLAWTVSFKDENRDFIGKKALLTEKQQGISHKLVGLVLEDRGVLRAHQKIKIEKCGEGEITSGSFSPTLGKSIALARIPVCDATEALAERRGEWLRVGITKPKFI